MAWGSRAVQTSLALNVALIVALFVVSGSSSILQGTGEYLFGRWVKDPVLAMYLFEAVLVGGSFLVSALAVHDIRGGAIDDYQQG